MTRRTPRKTTAKDESDNKTKLVAHLMEYFVGFYFVGVVIFVKVLIMARPSYRNKSLTTH
jgi:hypothetical protein